MYYSPIAECCLCQRLDGICKLINAVYRNHLISTSSCMTSDKNKIILPNVIGAATGSAFTSTKLFYSTFPNRKYCSSPDDGVYEKEFVTGYEFYRLTTRKDSLLYSTIFVTKKIHAYDIATGNLKYRFAITAGEARGLAFDPRGYLHVTTGS